MLIFYKRRQSEANMKLNEKKVSLQQITILNLQNFFQPQLFKEIRTLTSIRNETNTKIQQVNHYDEVKQKMQDV